MTSPKTNLMSAVGIVLLALVLDTTLREPTIVRVIRDGAAFPLLFVLLAAWRMRRSPS